MSTHAQPPQPPSLAAAGPKTTTTGAVPDPRAEALRCPRCDSANTKFCYYNNYSLAQPRHFCKACKRYWTRGGTLRNVPVGGGCRKNKRSSSSSKKHSSSSSAAAAASVKLPTSSSATLPGRSSSSASPRSMIPGLMAPLGSIGNPSLHSLFFSSDMGGGGLFPTTLSPILSAADAFDVVVPPPPQADAAELGYGASHLFAKLKQNGISGGDGEYPLPFFSFTTASSTLPVSPLLVPGLDDVHASPMAAGKNNVADHSKIDDGTGISCKLDWQFPLINGSEAVAGENSVGDVNDANAPFPYWTLVSTAGGGGSWSDMANCSTSSVAPLFY